MQFFQIYLSACKSSDQTDHIRIYTSSWDLRRHGRWGSLLDTEGFFDFRNLTIYFVGNQLFVSDMLICSIALYHWIEFQTVFNVYLRLLGIN